MRERKNTYSVSSNSLLDSMIENEQVRIAITAIMMLPKRQREIVICRLGLDNGDPRTFRQCGIEMGCSYQRIQQSFENAVKHIRQYSHTISEAPNVFMDGYAI